MQRSWMSAATKPLEPFFSTVPSSFVGGAQLKQVEESGVVTLPEKLPGLELWARREGVWEEVRELAGVAFVDALPGAYARVLRLLWHVKVREFLSMGAVSAGPSALLYRVSLALQRNPSVFQCIPDLTDAKSAKRHLKEVSEDALHEQCLLGALIPPVPPSYSEDEARAIEVLRAWLLVHALEFARLGSFWGGSVRTVAETIRQACEVLGDEKHKELLCALPIPPSGRILDVNYLDVRFVAHVKEQADVCKGQHRNLSKFLAALRNVATHQPGADALRRSQYDQSPYFAEAKPIFLAPSEGGGEDDRFPGLRDEGAPRVVLSSPDDTPAMQRLSERTVHLQGDEELQLLPWSWHRITTVEWEALCKWIEAALVSCDKALRGLGVVTSLALLTGRSLRQVCEFRISSVPDADWSLSPDFRCLVRLPPRPPGIELDEKLQRAWVKPQARLHRLALADGIVSALESLKGESAEEAPQGLWLLMAFRADKVATLFNDEIKVALPRLNSSMIAPGLVQAIFRNQHDAILARMLAATPQTGLPGALYYPGFTAGTVRTAWPESPWGTLHIDGGDQENAAGSQLDPLDCALREVVLRARQKLREADGSQDPVLRHNAFVQWVVVMLLAATGARPVDDPFEAVRDFDFEAGFVFVDDKHAGPRTGRCVPLPAMVLEQLRLYLSHLSALARSVEPSFPEFAAKIASLADVARPSEMPLFFSLSEANGGLQWQGVLSLLRGEGALFDWPLPANLFRHRFATMMREAGIETEVIEGCQGHEEVGEPTWGDNSVRVWADDTAALPAAQSVFLERLGFEPFSPAELVPVAGAAWHSSPEQPAVLFGRARREQARVASIRHAKKEALRIILEFRQTFNLVDLSAVEENLFLQLQQRLFLNSVGLRHEHGLVRLEMLQRLLDRERAKGVRIKLRHRVSRQRSAPSPFTQDAPGARGRYREAKDAFESALPVLLAERSGGALAAHLAVLGVCLLHRVADARLLGDLLQGNNVRLVKVGDAVVLQHGVALPAGDGRYPVQSITLRPTLVGWIARTLESKRRSTRPLDMPAALAPVAEALGVGYVGEFPCVLEAARKVVDAANALELPGIVAALRGGRLSSFSLGWLDLVRLHTGRQVSWPDGEGMAPAAEEGDAEAKIGRVVSIKPEDVFELSAEAKRLIQDVRRIIAAQRKFKSREAQADVVLSCLNKRQNKVSSAVVALIDWICAELRRKHKNGAFDLTPSSVLRYFTTLSPRFEKVAYNTDIHDLDGDELTEFYQTVLDACGTSDQSVVLDRLRSFHSWCRRTHGVEDPDWSILKVNFSAPGVSPGVLFYQDYLAVMHFLLDGPHPSTYKRAQAAVLFFAYRFGLRGREALQLHRVDVVEGTPRYVVVRPRYGKTLKRPSSRRRVPQLWTLTDLEERLLVELHAHAERVFGEGLDVPLVAIDTGELTREQQTQLLGAVGRLLKVASGNPDTTVHDARHAAANRVAACLMGIEHPALTTLFGEGPDSTACGRVREMLLAHPTLSRRAGWALRRYLGHSGSSTSTFLNYVHILGEWADACVGPNGGAIPSRCLSTIRSLNDLPVYSAPTPLLENVSVKRAPKLLDVFDWMHLVGVGHKPAHAAQVCNVEGAFVETAESFLSMVDVAIRLPSATNSSPPPADPHAQRKLVSHLSETAWARLRRHVCEHPKPAQQTDFPINPPFFREMLGASRQLLVWRAEHFAALRRFLDECEIPNDCVSVVSGKQTSEGVKAVALASGVALVEMPPKYRIDAATSSLEPGARVPGRAACVAQENNQLVVRSSIDLVVLFVAWCCWRMAVV